MDENQENKAEETKKESDLKQETMNTFNEAKEQMKNINFKEEAKEGKGLLLKLWKNPIETIKEIANDETNKAFKTSLLLVAVWAIIELIDIIIYYVTSKYASFDFLATLKTTIAPIITVIAMTLAIFIVNKKSKKSISKLLTSVAVAYIPSIISSVLWLLYRISTDMYKILSPVGGLLRVISIVLMYNIIKALANEEDETKVLKTFVKVEAIFYVISFAFSFLGISL